MSTAGPQPTPYPYEEKFTLSNSNPHAVDLRLPRFPVESIPIFAGAQPS